MALTLVNGFFAAAEISLLSVRRTRLEELAEEGRHAARIALRLRDNPERLLATVQVGITFVGATASALGGATLAQPIADWLVRVGLPAGAEQVALALVVTLVSVLSIVLGELVPKSLALRSSERVSLGVARTLHLIARAVRPLVWLLTALSNIVLRPFRDETTFSEARLSPEELQSLVEDAANAGSLAPSVGDITSRAIELGQLPVSSLLIPRRSIASIALDASRDTAWHLLKTRPHARYPVTEHNLDTILGYVTARDLVTQIIDTGRIELRAVLREIPAFTERTPAVDVLRALQRQHTRLGMVVDEHGMVAGIVTIHDIAEELLGEIIEEGERELVRIRVEAPGVARIRADTPIQDINRMLGTDLPVSTEYATLSGYLMHTSSRIMRPGERLEAGPITFEVIAASARRVELVRMLHRPPSS